MKRLAIIALPALGLLLAAPSGIAGEELPRLRASVTVASDIVTLGDLFANAGEHAGVAVFRAPDLGRSGAVAADIVARSAEAAGLTEFDRTLRSYDAIQASSHHLIHADFILKRRTYSVRGDI